MTFLFFFWPTNFSNNTDVFFKMLKFGKYTVQVCVGLERENGTDAKVVGGH